MDVNSKASSTSTEGVLEFVRFTVPNRRIAVEPFPAQALEKEVVGGVLKPRQKGSLQALKVVFHNEWQNIGPGWTVYIRADRNTTSTWGKEVFEADGKKFILVPEDEVLLLEAPF